MKGQQMMLIIALTQQKKDLGLTLVKQRQSLLKFKLKC